MAISSILIQGAAGFVGQSLLPMLIQRKGIERIFLVDRKPIPQKLIASCSCFQVEVYYFVNDSLLEIDLPVQPDIVISLAGMTNVDEALQNPKSAFDSNISIAINLGEWLRLQRTNIRLIYVSSDEVLGETFLPLQETAPLNPTQPYSASKAAAEIVLHNYRDVYKLNVVTLRSCNLIGGHLRARKLLPVSVKSILLDKPVPIYDDAFAKREWMAVEDLCEAIFCLMDERVEAGVYHAASGIHLTISQVLDVISDALGVPIEQQLITGRLVHDKCYATASNKLHALGWKPKYDPRKSIADAARQLMNPALLAEFKFEV
jgi:dTDP-glucose 4,6-dehydratase